MTFQVYFNPVSVLKACRSRSNVEFSDFVGARGENIDLSLTERRD
jgi:hypothetical protein